NIGRPWSGPGCSSGSAQILLIMRCSTSSRFSGSSWFSSTRHLKSSDFTSITPLVLSQSIEARRAITTEIDCPLQRLIHGISSPCHITQFAETGVHPLEEKED